MKKIKFLSYVFIVIMLCGFYGSINAFDIELGKIRITASAEDSSIVRYLAGKIVDTQNRFETFFAHQIRSPVDIVLAKSNDQYKNLSGWHIPEWSAAVTIPNRRIIILKPADYYDPEVYTVSLLHELAHIYLSDKLGQEPIPLWLNEGIAMFLSNKTINWSESTIAGNAVWANTLLSFSDIETLIRFKTGQAQIAYIQSFLSLQYFLQHYGEIELKNMIHAAANGISVQKYLLVNLDLDYEDLEYNTLKWIEDKYWWMIFLQFENLLWMFMLLLVFITIIIIKFRNRRKLTKWHNEDLLNGEG